MDAIAQEISHAAVSIIGIVFLTGFAGIVGAFALAWRQIDWWVRGTLFAIAIGFSLTSIAVILQSPYQSAWYVLPMLSAMFAVSRVAERMAGRRTR